MKKFVFICSIVGFAAFCYGQNRKVDSIQLSLYEPTVTISTKKSNDKVGKKVSDNGIGMPEKLLDKIFQPFFTAKPTGQGTGVGLSLSYDIVKAQGGEISVTTKGGEAPPG